MGSGGSRGVEEGLRQKEMRGSAPLEAVGAWREARGDGRREQAEAWGVCSQASREFRRQADSRAAGPAMDNSPLETMDPPSPLTPRRAASDGLTWEHGKMEDREEGHGEMEDRETPSHPPEERKGAEEEGWRREHAECGAGR